MDDGVDNFVITALVDRAVLAEVLQACSNFESTKTPENKKQGRKNRQASMSNNRYASRKEKVD